METIQVKIFPTKCSPNLGKFMLKTIIFRLMRRKLQKMK